MHEDLVVLADSVAVGAGHFGVELSDEGSEQGVVGLVLGVGQAVVDYGEEVDQQVVGVVLFVPLELHRIRHTPGR